MVRPFLPPPLPTSSGHSFSSQYSSLNSSNASCSVDSTFSRSASSASILRSKHH